MHEAVDFAASIAEDWVAKLADGIKDGRKRAIRRRERWVAVFKKTP